MVRSLTRSFSRSCSLWHPLRRISARFDGGTRDQLLNAESAASIARSTSRSVPTATRSTTSPVAGLRISVVPCSAPSHFSPAIINLAIDLWCSYDDAFSLQVILESLRAVLPPNSAELHATKRHFVVPDVQR